MRRLSRTVRDVTKSSTQYPGIITDVTADGHASVRLSRNGAIYKNLAVVGGPVKRLQAVSVDFTTPTPTIVAPGVQAQGVEAPAALRVRKPSITSTISMIGSNLICVYEGPDPKIGRPSTLLRSTFPVTSQGLDDAIAYAENGNVVYLPICSIGDDHTFPYTGKTGVTLAGTSKETSILTGRLTVSSSSFVRDISISYTGSEALVYDALCEGSVSFLNTAFITSGSPGDLDITWGSSIKPASFYTNSYYAITGNMSKIYAADPVGDPGGDERKLHYSTNLGQTWNVQTIGDPDTRWVSIGVSRDGSIVALGCVGDEGHNTDVWISTDSGLNFTQRFPTSGSSGEGWEVWVSRDGSTVFAGTIGSPGIAPLLYKSTNNGVSWTDVMFTPPHPISFGLYHMAIDGDGSVIVYVGRSGYTDEPCCYISSNGGTSWTGYDPAGNWSPIQTCSCDDDGDVITITYESGYEEYPIFVTYNLGSSWSKPVYPELQWATLDFESTFSSACSDDGSIIMIVAWDGSIEPHSYIMWSVDSGVNWNFGPYPFYDTYYSWWGVRLTSDGTKVLLVESGNEQGVYIGDLYPGYGKEVCIYNNASAVVNLETCSFQTSGSPGAGGYGIWGNYNQPEYPPPFNSWWYVKSCSFICATADVVMNVGAYAYLAQFTGGETSGSGGIYEIPVSTMNWITPSTTEPVSPYPLMMWMDPTSNILYVRNVDNDAWISIGGGIAGDGIAKITVGATEPSSPTAGDLWVDTS